MSWVKDWDVDWEPCGCMYLFGDNSMELVKMCGTHQHMMAEEPDQHGRGQLVELELQSPALKVRTA